MNPAACFARPRDARLATRSTAQGLDRLKAGFRILLVAPGLIFALIATGCRGATIQQMYPGDPLPEAETVRIEESSGSTWTTSTQAFILAVDGHEVSADAVDVLPGFHTVRVGAMLEFSGQRMRVQPDDDFVLNAYAGHAYRVKAYFDIPDEAYIPIVNVFKWNSIMKGITPFIWIEDAETGDLVAGESPMDARG